MQHISGHQDGGDKSPSVPNQDWMSWLASTIGIDRAELTKVLLSFGYFFAVLCAYYIVRPLREEMGVALKAIDKSALEWMFSIVFLVMLLAVPLVGYLTARVARSWIVPAVYGFFIGNLVLFWFVIDDAGQSRWIAGSFFVWVSVYNLFAISLFWSVMSDSYDSRDAKRVYGFISAGGSAGALLGSFFADALVKRIGASGLLWFCIAFLGLALFCFFGLLREARARGQAIDDLSVKADEPVTWRTLISGATRVWHNPFLFRIALVIFLANIVSTYFYLEQARIVGDALPDRADRVQLFARMNFVTSVGTIACEIFLTSRLIRWLGLGTSVSLVGTLAVVGLIWLALAPSLWLIVTLIVIERVVAFALSNPAKRVLFTGIAPEDKYKSQNFIDTVVFRGGDAVAGWIGAALSHGMAFKWGTIVITLLPAFGPATMAMVFLPLAVLWATTAYKLGAEHDRAHPDDKSGH